jgi:hypothetical protein
VCRECEPWEGVTSTHHVQKPNTYDPAIFAREFVKPGRVGLALAVRTNLLVGVVENVEVVVINVVASKDIGDKFEE